jgi:hypothetical protein
MAPPMFCIIPQPFLAEEIWSIILYDFCDGSTLAILLQVALQSRPVVPVIPAEQFPQQQHPTVVARHLVRIVQNVTQRRLAASHQILSHSNLRESNHERTPERVSCFPGLSHHRMLKLLESFQRSCLAANIDSEVGYDQLERILLALEYVEDGVCGSRRRNRQHIDDGYFDWPVWVGEILWLEDEASPLCHQTGERINVVIHSPWWWHVVSLNEDRHSPSRQCDQAHQPGNMMVAFCHHNVVPTPPLGIISGIRPKDKENLKKIKQRLVDRNEVSRGRGSLPMSPTTWYILSRQQAEQRVARTLGHKSSIGAALKRLLDAGASASEEDSELLCSWQLPSDDGENELRGKLCESSFVSHLRCLTTRRKRLGSE